MKMRKKAKASRTRSAKQDLPARKAGGVKGGSVKSSAVVLPYIEQDNVVPAAGPSAGGHVKVFDGRTGTGL